MRADYKKIGLLIALAALGCRFLFSFDPWSKPARFEDDSGYYELGRSLAFDGVLSQPAVAWEPDARRGFLYPVYLSLFAGRSADGWPLAVAGVFAASMALTVLLAAGALEAGLGAVPLLLFVFAAGRNFQSSLYIEQFYSVCVLLCAVLSVRWAKNPGGRESVMLGLSLAFSLACRSTLVFLPLILAVWGLTRLKNVPRRSVLLLLLCAYLPLSVWTARNMAYFQRFIPFEDRTAAGVLYTASVGLDQGLPGSEITERFLEQRPDLRGKPEEAEAAMWAAALRNISSAPASYLRGVLRRFLAGARLALEQSGWLVLPALLASLWFMRREKGLQVLGVFALYFIGVHSFLSVSERYFTPLAPVLCLLAAYCLRGFAGFDAQGRFAGYITAAVFSGFTLLYSWGCVALVREAAVMRNSGRGFHKRALALMSAPGGCEAGALLARVREKPPANPQVLSKVYSDSAVAAYFCPKDRGETARFLRAALAADPGNSGARTMLNGFAKGGAAQ